MLCDPGLLHPEPLPLMDRAPAPAFLLDREAWGCKESDMTERLNWTESFPVKESMAYFVKIIHIISSMYLFIYLLEQ